MSDEDDQHPAAAEHGAGRPPRVADVFTRLPRIAALVAVLSVGGLVVGWVKFDRARRGLTPPSVGVHGENVSPYEPAVLWIVAGCAGLAVAVLILIVAYKPQK